jgi:hypothetical protein
MLTKIIFLLLVFAGCVGAATAQTGARTPPIDTKPDDKPYLSDPMNEMRARMASRYAEKEHRENLDRASELARIAAEVKANFKTSQVLTKDDQKKVERIEKLAKKIRSEAGGSDGDLVSSIPANLGEAIAQIAELTDQLNKSVSAIPKLVISAGVIDQTNQLLQVVKYVRGMNR